MELNMNGLKKILLTSFLFTSQLSYGGGWTSGGGELIRDAHNPWFLSNTKEVTYCIQINEREFGQSKEFVRTQIQKAWDFWKIQLNELNYGRFGGTDFNFALATQNFMETACNRSVDIKFQFATLDSEQKQRMGDLSKTIAVSVRTDYDSVNLKGKGFIYFNRNQQFPILPWTRVDGARALPILIHEMGHIFGIQHDEDVWMMKEDYPEKFMEQRHPEIYDQISTYTRDHYQEIRLFSYRPSMLNLGMCSSLGAVPKPPPTMNSNVKAQSAYEEFFGQSVTDNCHALRLNGSSIEFSSGKDSMKIIGKAELTQKNLDSLTGMRIKKDIVQFWIPPEQTVFAMSDYMKATRFTIGDFQPKQFFKGIYRTLDGRLSRQVAIEVSNGGSINRISGVMDGVLYSDVELGF